MENTSFHDRFFIRPVCGKHVDRFVIQNHYAQKMPTATIYMFGLFKNTDHILVGVMTFSHPVGSKIQHDCPFPIIELTRIALINNEKNLVSWWMSRCFSFLQKPVLLISFADANKNHVGFVYQATNWIYSGLSSINFNYIYHGKRVHHRTLGDKQRKNLEIADPDQVPKYRYFYPLGSKKQRKEMIEYVKNRFGIFPYPKSDNQYYEMEKEREKKRNFEGGKGFGL